MARTSGSAESNESVATADVPIVKAIGLTKHYGAVRALEDVSLEIHSGEVVSLVGDNGAGKSTFVKMLSGVEQPTAGQLIVKGTEATFADPSESRRLGIEAVYQDLALVGHIDVGGNLFLGREPTIGGKLGKWLGILDLRGMAKRAEEALAELKVTLPSVRAPVGTMSGGQRQATAIARTAMWGNQLLILDEPTAALGVRESEEALRMIEDVASTGIPLIMISHNVEHVFRVSTRVVVFRHGRMVADLPIEETSPEEVVGYITGAREAITNGET